MGTEKTKGDAFGYAVAENISRMFHRIPNAELVGENIGGSGGEDAERHVGVGHSVDNFIDSAVAAGDKNEVGAVIDGIARDSGGASGTVGGDSRDGVTVRRQQIERMLERMCPPL